MWQKIKSFLFKNTSTRQTVAKNTFWLTVGQIGGRVLRSAIIIYSARVLGAEGWGVFSYAVTLAGFLTVFIDFGINPIITRETAKTADFEERSKILSTSFFLKISFLAIGVFIVLFLAPYFTNIQGVRVLLPVVAAIMVFDALREFGFSLSRAIEKMEWEAGLFILTNIAIVAFGFLFLFLRPTPKSLAYSYALGTGIGTIATFYALRKDLGKLFHNFSRKLVKPILSSSWPFAISGVLGALMINTDILIIGSLLGALEVGLYSAGLRIVQLLYLLPAIVAISVLPTFSRLARQDNGKVRLVLERTVSLLFLIAIPTAVGGVILGSKLIGFLFGSAFLPGTISFQVLIMTLVIDFPAVIISSAIFAYNEQKSLMVYAAIGGFTNVLFDLILIPRFGINGSAWATLTAELVSNAYLWNKMNSLNAFRVFPYLKNILVSTFAMSLAVLVLSGIGIHVIVTIALGVLIYFGILYKLKEPLLKEMVSIVRHEPVLS